MFTLTAPATGAAGTTVTVTDTVKNQGAGQAAASRTRFYFSANSVLDAADVLLPDSRALPGLATGATNTGTTNVTIPSSAAQGTYFIIGKADGDGAIAETNETNNTSARSIQIGADLLVSALTVPEMAGPIRRCRERHHEESGRRRCSGVDHAFLSVGERCAGYERRAPRRTRRSSARRGRQQRVIDDARRSFGDGIRCVLHPGEG